MRTFRFVLVFLSLFSFGVVCQEEDASSSDGGSLADNAEPSTLPSVCECSSGVKGGVGAHFMREVAVRALVESEGSYEPCHLNSTNLQRHGVLRYSVRVTAVLSADPSLHASCGALLRGKSTLRQLVWCSPTDATRDEAKNSQCEINALQVGTTYLMSVEYAPTEGSGNVFFMDPCSRPRSEHAVQELMQKDESARTWLLENGWKHGTGKAICDNYAKPEEQGPLHSKCSRVRCGPVQCKPSETLVHRPHECCRRCVQLEHPIQAATLRKDVFNAVMSRLKPKMGYTKATHVARDITERIIGSRLISNQTIDPGLISSFVGEIIGAEVDNKSHQASSTTPNELSQSMQKELQEKMGKKFGEKVGKEMGKKIANNVGRQVATKVASRVGTRVATQIASRIAMAAAGPIAGAALGGITLALGMIGDAVQKHKCKLRCCPSKGLKGSFACKYQTKSTCIGFYSDYPGHGDHACHWNEEKNVCEVGMVCRDKTFNFFALVGSVCPPCPKEGYQGKQWTKDELKKADLLTRFYVDPRTEYVWCAAHGIPSCFKEKNKAKCESSYADHKPDRNCHWVNGSCKPGKFCHNDRDKQAAAKLGLSYSDYAWRRRGHAVDAEYSRFHR